MNIFRISLLLFIFSTSSSCQFEKETDLSITINSDLEKALINEIVDSWHRAASTADSLTYFDIIASDQSIFQGTDDNERWTKSEFKKWSREYFKGDSAWTFTPKKGRNISIRGSTAWFDEQLDSDHMGRCRGNGVLIKEGEVWKIAHYTLSLPIPNEIADDVIESIRNIDNKS
tara:strand:- start:347 stop:865 length:519 start_codon:yes stop_codon:yes gene_type:complete